MADSFFPPSSSGKLVWGEGGCLIIVHKIKHIMYSYLPENPKL